jgi:hypothetical protein
MLVFLFSYYIRLRRFNVCYKTKTKPKREEEQMSLWIRETSGVSWLNENLAGLL